MLALFTCYCTAISYVPRNMLQVPNTSTGQVLRKRYIDKSDLFSVSYPAFGKLNSTSSSYTRFEYIDKVTDDYSPLTPLEFYLEIFKDEGRPNFYLQSLVIGT